MIPPEGQSCANCKYSTTTFRGSWSLGARLCLRFPPTPVINADGYLAMPFRAAPTPVEDQHWCFEWKPIESTGADAVSSAEGKA